MSDLVQNFFSTTVLAAVVAGVVTLAAPWLAERRKKAANGAIERARQETTLVGTAERLTRELLERLGEEVSQHQSRIRALEGRDAEVRALLYALLEDLHELNHMLERPVFTLLAAEELDAKRMQMEERVRRGLRLWEESA